MGVLVFGVPVFLFHFLIYGKFMFFFPLAMIAASLEFGEAIKEVYEPDWASRDVVFQLLDVRIECFFCLLYNTCNFIFNFS